MDHKYRGKLEEIEIKSAMLERGLGMVEEMRAKVEAHERQQSEYNSLLMKYNQLLY